MIVRSKAPLRLGLAGGGSDVSPYSDIYGGLILNATINLYTYCTIEETDDGMITIDSDDSHCHKSYPKVEYLNIDGEASLIKGVYNRVIRDFDISPRSFKITTYNDAPAGSGLGTSSAMVVCVLKAFIEWLGLPLGDYETSRLAYEIERKDLNLSGGKQDQYAAAFGGFNYMEFLQNDLVIVNPLKIKRWIVDELEASIALLLILCIASIAFSLPEEVFFFCWSIIAALLREAMHRIKRSAIDMKFALLKGDMQEFARILGEGWEDKKKMADAITNPMIQNVFDTAMSAGALAGKVSGAGGGGFVMLMVEPTRKKEVIDALNRLDGFVMPFQFTEGGAHGWRIYSTDKVK